MSNVSPTTAAELRQLRGMYEQFMPLSDSLFTSMASVLTVKEYRKGEFFVRTGEVCCNVGFVVKGLFRTYYELDGSEVVAGFFYEPGFVTEYSSFLRQEPSHRTLVAMEPSRVLCMNFADLQTLYSEHGAEGERLGRLVAEHLFHAFNDRAASLMLETPEQRYLSFEQRSKHLLQRVPLYHIASYLNITPETLSRIRRRLQLQLMNKS